MGQLFCMFPLTQHMKTQSIWNMLITGCNFIFTLNQRPETMLLMQGQCHKSKQPLPAAELGFTPPPAWPSHREQCDCWTWAQALPYTQGLKAPSCSFYLSFYLYHSLPLSLLSAHKQHTLNTQRRPCPSPLGCMNPGSTR